MAKRENREESKPKKNSSLLKILLIIAIAICTLPIVFPLVLAGVALYISNSRFWICHFGNTRIVSGCCNDLRILLSRNNMRCIGNVSFSSTGACCYGGEEFWLSLQDLLLQC